MAGAANARGDEVIEVAVGDEQAILGAVMRVAADQVAECAVRPPGGVVARLAVDREHRAVLVAVVEQGLKNLPAIGRAYAWVMDNRALLKRALPEMAIAAETPPRLWLLLDEADRGADAITAILRAEAVSVRTYRRVRWGGKTGLLLSAA